MNVIWQVLGVLFLLLVGLVILDMYAFHPWWKDEWRDRWR